MSRPPRFPTAEVVRILVVLALLVAVTLFKGRCGPAAATLLRAVDAPVDGG